MESMADELQKPVAYLSGMTSFVLDLLYVIFVPLHLYDVYMTYRLSLQFAHDSLAVFLLALCLAIVCERISFDVFMLLMIPASIGLIAKYEWSVISLVSAIIVFVVLVYCDKNGDVKDIAVPVGPKEESV